MEYQVRRYRIAAGKMEEFVEGWRSQVVPLRVRLGFVVHGAWALDATNEFVWVLSHAGPGDFAAANDAYYASPERTGMDPNPAEHIEEIHETMARGLL